MSTDAIDSAKYPLTLQGKPFSLGKTSAYEGELFAIYEGNGLTIREVGDDEEPREIYLAIEHYRRLLEFTAACNAEIIAQSAPRTAGARCKASV